METCNNLNNNWECVCQTEFYSSFKLFGMMNDGLTSSYGGIMLDPDYQRDFKFDAREKSSIIESMLLGIPIPTVYLSKDLNNDVVIYNVIDGTHRLKSIYEFMNNKFKLTGLKLLDLNGSTFNTLPAAIRNKFNLSTGLYITTVDISQNKELEYEVFLRFNKSTNPLTKQELNDVLYKSDFSNWFKKTLIPDMCKDINFRELFIANKKRISDKTLNYDVYTALGYPYLGLREGKSDTPYYVIEFMSKLKNVENLDIRTKYFENFLKGLVEFYTNIKDVTGISYIFSKEFTTMEVPVSNHRLLISFIIPLSMAYDYLKNKGILDYNMSSGKYLELYNVIAQGMNNVEFGDFAGVSSTSYPVQKACYDSIKLSIDNYIKQNKIA